MCTVSPHPAREPAYFTVIPSPVGEITAVCRGESITNLWICGQPGIDLSRAIRRGDDPLLSDVRTWLTRYFAGEIMTCHIPMVPQGTVFQKRVWSILETIPYGQIVTYGQIASALGNMSPQAVGQAVGANPISILIPCHRVLGAGGKLTGYAGGLDKKIALLDLEGISYKH